MLTIRRIRKPAHCRVCGQAIKPNQYGSEVAIVLTITLCCDCAYDHKERIFNLPASIALEHEYLPTSEPLKALTKIGG